MGAWQPSVCCILIHASSFCYRAFPFKYLVSSDRLMFSLSVGDPVGALALRIRELR